MCVLHSKKGLGMSTGNIVAKTVTPDGGLAVTFHLKDGSLRTYYYDQASSVAIIGGADPKYFPATQLNAGNGIPSLQLIIMLLEALGIL